MTDLTTSALRRLYRSAYSRLREDFAAQTADTIERETERLLQIQANELLAQVTAIVNGNASPTDKIGELVSLLIEYDDEYDDQDDDDPNTTAVDVYPRTK